MPSNAKTHILGGKTNLSHVLGAGSFMFGVLCVVLGLRLTLTSLCKIFSHVDNVENCIPSWYRISHSGQLRLLPLAGWVTDQTFRPGSICAVRVYGVCGR